MLCNQNSVDNTGPLYSPSPVTESSKNFRVRVQRKFLFHVLIQLYDFQKNFGANHKIANQPQNPQFSKWQKITMAPNFICEVKIQMPTTYRRHRWKGNFIRINTVLRIRVQKWTYFEVLVENRRDMFLKVVAFFLKIAKI